MRIDVRRIQDARFVSGDQRRQWPQSWLREIRDYTHHAVDELSRDSMLTELSPRLRLSYSTGDREVGRGLQLGAVRSRFLRHSSNPLLVIWFLISLSRGANHSDQG